MSNEEKKAWIVYEISITKKFFKLLCRYSYDLFLLFFFFWFLAFFFLMILVYNFVLENRRHFILLQSILFLSVVKILYRNIFKILCFVILLVCAQILVKLYKLKSQIYAERKLREVLLRLNREKSVWAVLRLQKREKWRPTIFLLF